jgi:16S rRNA (guanine1207-N2)-methyltransferase
VSGLPELVVTSHAGVFSAGGHDEGSLFLLRHLADRAGGEQPEAIVDCGCGNGLLALAAARLYPGARLACADESFMAIASARAGFEANGLAGRASFHWTDCLDGLAPASADLVLCNPPFHRLQTQTLAIAGRMFAQARGVLAPGGRLLVVANRHLGYLPGLERLFPQVRVVAENARYRLIEALA